MMIDQDRLQCLVEQGYVAAKKNGPLTLYNYTAQCTWEGLWEPCTRMARGLVLDEAGTVMARPFEKFFNLGERPETKMEALPANTPEIYEKLDGTLIIVFWNPYCERWQCVTRGSWSNQWIDAANRILNHRKACIGFLDPSFTYLFELVAPWNRIVVRYDDERLVLLGARHNQIEYEIDDAGMRDICINLWVDQARKFAIPLIDLNLGAGKGTDQEGYVLKWPSGFRVKAKFEEYVRLHGLLTGMSKRKIWEILRAGQDPLVLAVSMPDEFYEWCKSKIYSLNKAKSCIEGSIESVFRMTPKFETRKEYALHWQGHDKTTKAILFMMLDGYNYQDLLWRAVEPKGKDVFQEDGQ